MCCYLFAGAHGQVETILNGVTSHQKSFWRLDSSTSMALRKCLMEQLNVANKKTCSNPFISNTT